MKATGIILFVIISLFTSDDLWAQRAHRRDKRHVVVVQHSRFRPKHRVTFRPHWNPKLTCHRRWVYFPRLNFYWDNWRNHYYYFNGTVWISKSKAPATIADVDLVTEKYYELGEAEDDNDDIAAANDAHKEKFKGAD